MSDSISRQDAIDALDKRFDNIPMEQTTEILLLRKDLREMPSTQLDRDVPKEPKEETDTSLGCRKIPVCPECDRHLSFVAFIESGKGEKTTYCEHCGQAIDWEGWIFDE